MVSFAPADVELATVLSESVVKVILLTVEVEIRWLVVIIVVGEIELTVTFVSARATVVVPSIPALNATALNSQILPFLYIL
ncbi:hypothetical protein OS787_00380 [Pediococcus pentosaceus]|nr:hypothetical protein [Pediococcus pentosaceus]